VLTGTAVPRPRDCTFSPGDWEVLGRYWHPILFSTDVADTPVRAKLLDVDLVVYRASKGVVAARDLCMHRGSPLSMGHMQGDEIVCAYHGWRYGPRGECVRIPSQPASVRIPSIARSAMGLSGPAYRSLARACRSARYSRIPCIDFSSWACNHGRPRRHARSKTSWT
jgi:nitrite reductase/ring-hydroxylating ferredoxin subunit